MPAIWSDAKYRPASKLMDAVHSLHAAGFVHGDLREPNVLVSAGGEVSLIDFSWAGRPGSARYPHFMLPDGASDGQAITLEHDHWQLDRLLKL